MKNIATALAVRLSKDERKAMHEVRTGADVWSPVLARYLRDVQRRYPHFIDIGKPRGQLDGAGAIPYFGAVLTAAGIAALDAKKGGAR